MARYLVGIDLGTTNSALAYIDRQAKGAGKATLHTYPVAQLVAAGEVGPLPLLPSFLYIPGPHDLPPGAIAVPWNPKPIDAAGAFARAHGGKVPGRLVSSAKSWLCHPGVDRTMPLLPWGAPPDALKVSPLEASAKYLKHLVDAWNAAPGRPAADRLEEQPVVLTVPASFDDTARNLTAEAAKLAGLKHVTLLEEPQAAFYAWLGTHTPAEAGKLRPGMRCLVIDVGGGTTDLSLILVGEEQGDLTFVREAVGDHLLLGGDNMDLALAKAVEAKLPAGRLDAAPFGALVQACRGAKEAMLSPHPPATYPVTVVGRGRSVVASTVSVDIVPADVTAVLLDGFFPKAAYGDEPERSGGRAGLQEMGLPYVADPAVTRHLAAFLRQHLPAGGTVDAILFNGGVFTPPALRERVLDVMRPWFDTPTHPWAPLVLTSPSLDLAVAWGAAYAAHLKQSGGRRIGGGIPRSYYLGVEPTTEATAAGHLSVVCVVPRHLQEGEEVTIPAPVFELALGRPVLFPLFTSTVRGDDKPGDLLTLAPSQVLQLPPLHTVLRGGKRAGAKRVPVTLAAKNTEIGTLELYCVSDDGNRWRLEFNVRDATLSTPADGPAKGPVVVDVFPEEKLQAAAALIRHCYDGRPPDPPELPKAVEAALQLTRSEWPTGLCRRVWDDLASAAPNRARSPKHLARWYNLAGFCLRPGFGDPLDRYRVDAVWKLINAPPVPGSPPAVGAGGADYWILWRRVAGGLNTPLQQQLWTRLKPVLLAGRGGARADANELAEMWRAAASLERLDQRTRQQLGEELLRQIDRAKAAETPAPPYAFWALTRLGGRHPLYGPLNTVVHPDTAERWLDILQAYPPATDAERLNWAFCLAQLARRTGLRGVDVTDAKRGDVAALLRGQAVPVEWAQGIEEVTAAAGDEQSRLFGEGLPIGLRLAG